MEANRNEEEKEKSPIKSLNVSQRSLFISQLDKEIDINFKVENINEGVVAYPSMEQRVNESYIVGNEDYFNNFKQASIFEDGNDISTNKTKRNFNNFPNRTELSLTRDNIIRNSLESFSPENNRQLDENVVMDKNELPTKVTNVSNLISKREKKVKDRTLPYFSIVEKCEIKDIIGFHKMYEIQYLELNEEKKIKCFRRYNNFYKFNNKISRMYPFLLIPKLTPKNPLGNIIRPDNEFYESRRIQLEFYLNFLFKHEFISKTREFYKFTNDAEFDEEYFISKENLIYENSFTNSLKITDNLKNKIFSVFSGIFGEKEGRKLSNDELLLGRMETHYKGITEKYSEIKSNVISYLKSIKLNAEGYNKLSNTCLYLKDSLKDVESSKDEFKIFHDVCKEVYEVNKKEYTNTAIDLENKFESFISVLVGLCNSFDRYNEFKKVCDNVLKAYRHAKVNRLYNLDTFTEELSLCDKLKLDYDKKLLNEVKMFVEDYDSTLTVLMEEFKSIIKSINSQTKSVNIKPKES